MKITILTLCLLLVVWPPREAQSLEIDIDPDLRVETVPSREWGRGKNAHAGGRSDLSVLVADTRRLISLSERYADTRYLGFAAGLLSAWKNTVEVPAEIQLMRAILAQKKHQFSAALVELNPALEVPALAAEAWFVKAMVHQAMGDHTKAIGSCYTLAQFTPAVVASACLASEFIAMGQSEMARNFVSEQALQDVPLLQEGVRQWVLTVYAEVSSSRDPALATAYFRRALAIQPSSPYLLKAYAQHLLDQGLAPAVAELLSNRALDAPLLWLQCRALRTVHGESDFLNCVAELKPKALLRDYNNVLIYPELVEEMGLSGSALLSSREAL